MDETGSHRAKRVRDEVQQATHIPLCEISRKLTKGLSKEKGRVAIFEFVRDFQYRIGNWRPNHPEDILVHYQGDCRHKSDLLSALLKCDDYEVRSVKVVFDWADLPVPEEIVHKRGVSRAFHDAVEVYIRDKWVYVDPTWGLNMKGRGFPVTENWDGISATSMVTNGSVQIVEVIDTQDVALLHEKYKVPWPIRAKNLRFVKSFNAWLMDGSSPSPPLTPTDAKP